MSDIQIQLEEMVDKYGLPTLLGWLRDICYEKGEHVRTNWQDGGLASGWESDARALDFMVGMVQPTIHQAPDLQYYYVPIPDTEGELYHEYSLREEDSEWTS